MKDLRSLEPKKTWKLDKSKIQSTIPRQSALPAKRQAQEMVRTQKVDFSNLKPTVPSHKVAKYARHVREVKNKD